MTKILDIAQSISAANDNVSLAKELFTMLISDLEKRLQQIESSFQSENMDSLSEHIHKLCGATAYVIVPKLRESTKTLDETLKNKDYDKISYLVNDVIIEIRQLINSAPAFIEKDWQSYKNL